MPVEKPVTTTCVCWGLTFLCGLLDPEDEGTTMLVSGDINLCQYCCENFTSCSPHAIAEHFHDSPKIIMWCDLMHDLIIYRENNTLTC
jgi:hypothetical protein